MRFMNGKKIILTALFCMAILFCAGKKAEAAFPYDMEQKPVTATSIQDGKVSVYNDKNLENIYKCACENDEKGI